MGLAIHHNDKAAKVWRNLNAGKNSAHKNVERLSTGQRINRAVDGPSSLVISEYLRSYVKSSSQAIDNSNLALSVIQTAEGGLEEVNSLLIHVRQLIIHSLNEGANDDKILHANEVELQASLSSINTIGKNTRFSDHVLLDGSKNSIGSASGKNVEFISASALSESSPLAGYPLDVTQVATRSEMTSPRALSKGEIMEGGIDLSIEEHGRKIMHRTLPGQTPEMIVNIMNRKAERIDLHLKLSVTQDRRFKVTHDKHGSDKEFFVWSSKKGILSKDRESQKINNGKDIQGTLAGKEAQGLGQILTGGIGTEVEDVKVKFTGQLRNGLYINENGDTLSPSKIHYGEDGFPALTITDAEGKVTLVTKKAVVNNGGKEASLHIRLNEENQPIMKTKSKKWIPISVNEKGFIYTPDGKNPTEGRIHVNNNTLLFQLGPNLGQNIKVLLPNIMVKNLSVGIENKSKLLNLSEITVLDQESSESALKLVDAAIDYITGSRGKLGAFQKHTLDTNLLSLQYQGEKITEAESAIRDTDIAYEMSDYTKNQIIASAGASLLIEANQAPKTVVKLLDGI